MTDHLEHAFRSLREHWFAAHLFSPPHDRAWETPQCEEARNARNAELKSKYDAQTEAIIAGEKWPIAPTCAADLEVEP